MAKGVTLEIHYTNEDYDSVNFYSERACLLYLARLLEMNWKPERDEMGNPRFVAHITMIDNETDYHL